MKTSVSLGDGLRIGFLALSLAALLNGCAKTDSTTSGTFTDVYTNTLSKACIECHVPTGAATLSDSVQLDFSSQSKAYTTLTSGNAHGNSSVGTCGSVKIVSAGSATRSYLAGVLFSDYNKSDFAGVSGCTPYAVHLSDQHLSDSEKTSIVNWINNGAQNN